MKILYVLENYWPNIGGVERLFGTLAESLAAEGHQITVYTGRLNASDPKEEIINGVRLIRSPYKGRYLFSFTGKKTLQKLAGEADIIHTTSYNAALPAYTAAKKANKPAIITFHEVWTDIWEKLPVYSGIEKAAFRKYEKKILKLPFNCFVGVSRYTSQRLVESGIPENKVQTIYNGIPETTKIWKEPDSEEFRVAYFGRLGASKGLDILVEGAALFHQKNPSIRLNIISPDVPARFNSWLNKIILKNNSGSFIRRIKPLSDAELRETLINHHCVAAPSLSEGFCFSAVEACALGIPVISSGNGALKETVSGKYAEMIEFSATGIANALEQAFNKKWHEKPPAQFPLEKTVGQYKELYSSFI
jgi:glycosyltransferase involved in cell wall biosynthesis